MEHLPKEALVTMLNFCNTGFLVINDQHIIEGINAAGARIFGYTADELTGQDLNVLIGNAPSHTKMVEDFRNNSAVRRNVSDRRILFGRTKEGEYIRLNLTVEKLSENLSCAVFSMYDDSIAIDALTGLYTRAAFFSELEFYRASEFSMIFIDLDKFKPINDKHGHVYGDQVLAVIGKRLKHLLRESDMVGRYGGDEFVVLVPTVDTKIVNRLMEKIYEAINEPINTIVGLLSVTCSLGYSTSREASDVDDIIHIADQRMYSDKNFA